MTDDHIPPTPLPPAARSPYPAHPAPHTPASEEQRPEPAPPPPLIGGLGLSLIGGAITAAIGMVVVLPLLRRKAAPKPRRGRPRKKP